MTRTPIHAMAGTLFLITAGHTPTVHAQDIEQIVVVGITPDGSARQALEELPFAVQSVSAQDLAQAGTLDLSEYLNRRLASVNINSAQNNPLQADLQYRGFTASPMLGLPQGLSVFQNGVRVNDPLGDAVNWDLLPRSAIARMDLMSGANPVFGLNTLGGALAIRMKDGFQYSGTEVEASTGSWGRQTLSLESGGNNGRWGYYVNLHHFNEDGWRQLSDSDASNFYSSLNWRPDERTALDLSYQQGRSDLTGNGPLPEGLASNDRRSVFTAPDITRNDLQMLTLEGRYELTPALSFSVNTHWRRTTTHAFNGDGADFEVCQFAGGQQALFDDSDEIEDALAEQLGIELDTLCEGEDDSIDSFEALEDYIAATALAAGLDPDDFGIDNITSRISGSGVLSGEAINNISRRQQNSRGINAQFHWLTENAHQITGGVYAQAGDARFHSMLELSGLDPLTRSTAGLGTGSYLDSATTDIRTDTDILSVYLTDTFPLSPTLTATLSARYNLSDVELRDRSRVRPELNGKHRFARINPAAGITWNPMDDFTAYASYSESNRTPTPIELACNEGVFELAQTYAEANGEDPDDIDFECRLPNAFLADPPLDDVVTQSIELGMRGSVLNTRYQLSAFRARNRDDILFQTTGRATGLFANVDETRRQGLELSLQQARDTWQWYAAASVIRASFEDRFLALSPNHPFANDDGEIQVQPGDRIPGVPELLLKAGADYSLNAGLEVGLEWVYNGPQYLRGDENNALPKIDGYDLINARLSWQVNSLLSLSASISNLFDRDYENFGLLGEDPSELIPGLQNTSPRFLGIGAPRAAWLSARLKLPD
ncbi:MAG: TonB-dependent receptor [Pseudomonadales bacterium]|nr:TonB-dependent receptor [Pseudomonadales bacterium]